MSNWPEFTCSPLQRFPLVRSILPQLPHPVDSYAFWVHCTQVDLFMNAKWKDTMSQADDVLLFVLNLGTKLHS